MRKNDAYVPAPPPEMTEKPPEAPEGKTGRFRRKTAVISGLALCLAAACLTALPPATAFARHQAEQLIESERVRRMIERERQEAEMRARDNARIEDRRKRRTAMPPELEESAARDESRRQTAFPEEEEEEEDSGTEDGDSPDNSDASAVEYNAASEDITDDNEPGAEAERAAGETGVPADARPFPDGTVGNDAPAAGDTPEETPADEAFPEDVTATAAAEAETITVTEEASDDDEPGEAYADENAGEVTDESEPEGAGDSEPESAAPPPAGRKPAARTPRPVEPPPELLEPSDDTPAYGRRPRVVIRQRSTEAAAELPDDPRLPERENWNN